MLKLLHFIHQHNCIPRISQLPVSTGCTSKSLTSVGLTNIYDVPPHCPLVQPVLPISHQPKQNKQSQPTQGPRPAGTPCNFSSSVWMTPQWSHPLIKDILVRGLNLLLLEHSQFQRVSSEEGETAVPECGALRLREDLTSQSETECTGWHNRLFKMFCYNKAKVAS